MLSCAWCGLTNRPYEAACAICGRQLQDPDDAAGRLKEWDAMSPGFRREQEEHFDRLRDRFDEHRRWLIRHRRTHAILGALMVDLAMGGSTFFQTPLLVPVDLAIGAGAALYLNRRHGGAWTGYLLFTGACLFSSLLRFGVLKEPPALGGVIIFPLVMVATLLVGGLGYLFGLKLDFEHADRSMVA